MGKCSTCGKDTKTFDILLDNGAMLSFCGNCLSEMQKFIGDEAIIDAKGKGKTIKSTHFEIPTPVQIKDILDDYVIGQEEAKKTM